jgi:hypothetical protein
LDPDVDRGELEGCAIVFGEFALASGDEPVDLSWNRQNP